jgi:hypothetical protein
LESAEAQPSQDAETNKVSESPRKGKERIAGKRRPVAGGCNSNEEALCGDAAGCAAGFLSSVKFPAKERENETGIVGILLNILTLESDLRLRNIVS